MDSLRSVPHPDVPPCREADNRGSMAVLGAVALTALLAAVAVGTGRQLALGKELGEGTVVGGGIAAAVLVVILAVALVLASARRSERRKAPRPPAGQPSEYTEAELSTLAAEAPAVGELLARAQRATDELREALAGPVVEWLPFGVRDVAQAEWELTRQAWSSRDLRAAIAEASEEGASEAVVALAEIRAETVAAVDAELAEQVQELERTVESATELRGRLRDLELAERLGDARPGDAGSARVSTPDAGDGSAASMASAARSVVSDVDGVLRRMTDTSRSGGKPTDA